MATDFGFMPVKKGTRYFISYKTEDCERVGKIAREMNKMGVPMWYDYGIKKGEKWNTQITENISECDAVVLFVTKQLFAAEDTYVRKEYRLANDYHKKIYAVWLDSVEFDDVSQSLKIWYYDIDELQGIKATKYSANETAWHAVNEFELEHGKEPQPVTPTYQAPQTVSAPVPASPASKPVSAPVAKVEVRVGDIIKFGQYPQGANGEVAPVEWRVLDVKDGRALLLSDKLLDYVKYNEELGNVTWETCTLRKWMNEEFIRKAFSSEEQSKIATVTNANPNNPKYGTAGGNATQDKVFALSIDDIKKYFSSGEARKAYATEYAYKISSYWIKEKRSSKDTLWWWLRSPGCDSDGAAYVLVRGGIRSNGLRVNYNGVAVRPAFWLNL